MAAESGLPLVHPHWPAPATVRAVVTTRQGGVSRAPYASFNLAAHTGDRARDVAENRRRLVAATGVAAVQWLEQVHGTAVIEAHNPAREPAPEADALWTTERHIGCAVLTADCLPVLLCDRAGALVAAVHAGWRGLVAGIIEQTVAAMPVPPTQLLAWLGPGISGPSYEVGADVHAAVEARFGTAVADQVLAVRRPDKWSFDLEALARRVLMAVGVRGVYGGGFCTRKDERFYSFRRDGTTGRMATMIWRT